MEEEEEEWDYHLKLARVQKYRIVVAACYIVVVVYNIVCIIVAQAQHRVRESNRWQE